MSHVTRWLLCLSAALLMLGGCDMVVSIQPMGGPLSQKQLDQAETLTGVWANEDDALMYVKHVGDGEFRLAWLSWAEGGFKLEQETAELGVLDARVFVVNLERPDQAKAGPRDYWFLLLKRVGESVLILLPPHGDTFAAAVESGDLPGEIERGEYDKTIRLTGEKETTDAYVRDNRNRGLFMIDAPTVLRRVGKLEEKGTEKGKP
jgi:hypothetical protein